jgi:ADP-ribose pyrophosphatase YjhB (NUDIX family)
VTEREQKAPRDYPQRPILGVAAVILRRGPGALDEVLLVKRGNPPSAGQWSVPGGAVKLGETVAVALRREVAEEVGLKVSVGPLVAVLDRVFKDAEGRIQYHYVLLDYLCQVVSGELAAASDAAEARFVPLGELKGLRLTRGTRAVIERARRIQAATSQ